MPVTLSIDAIASAFPRYRVGVVIATDLAIPATRPPALDALIREREAAARVKWQGLELAAIPGIAAWREAYKGFGIKQTRYRSSVERLVKNVLGVRLAENAEGAPLYVMVKDDGRWQLAACQNTPVHESPASAEDEPRA